VIDYIQQCHHKNESVLLLGDYNLSYNDSTHRFHPNTISAHTQHNALCSRLTPGGLTDICDIPHTWASPSSWSSPDHISLSTSSPLTAHSPYRDTTPWEAKLSDHALLGITLHFLWKSTQQPQENTLLPFQTGQGGRICGPGDLPFGDITPVQHHFINACMTAHMALASSPRYTKQAAPDTHKLHKTYILLAAHLHRLESKFFRPSNPHPMIQGEPLWDREALVDRICQLKCTIDNKARKRATLRMALFRKARSALYTSKRYGRFLQQTLNRGIDLIGVVAVRTATGITTATADVIRQATTRMQDTFFTWRQNIPPYFLQYNDTAWHKLPAWVQTVVRTGHVLSPITISDLRFCLKGCKNNKSGGP
jgi:hypothetical protein